MNNENQDLHSEIDELALDIEKKIKRGKEINEKFSDTFDSKYRRMEEANIEDVELFG